MIKVLIFIYFFCNTFSHAEELYSEHIQKLKIATVSDLKVAYIDEGAGDPIVLLHGIPTNSWMYRKLIKELSKTNRVIAPDLIGFGQSQKPRKALSLERHSEIITSFLTKNLKLNTFKLIVHDFGGPVAWGMLGSNSFKVTELIILNTFLFKKGWNHGFNFFTNLANQVLPNLMSTSFFGMGIKDMFYKEQTQGCFTGYISPFKEKYSKNAYKKLYRSIPHIQKRLLPKYQKNTQNYLTNIPVKIIWGKHDKFLDSTVQLEQIATHLKVTKENILLISDGKHLIADENSDEILAFLKRSDF